jgi:hypothetical protein
VAWCHPVRPQQYVVLTGIKNIRDKYKKTASHEAAILLGYSGLIQQRIE